MPKIVGFSLAAALLFAASMASYAEDPAQSDGPETFCKAGCVGMPDVHQCVLGCLRSPAPKVAYTVDMAPIGTPVPLDFGSMRSDRFERRDAMMGLVTSDVVVNGRVIIKKNALALAHFVGTSCAPSVGLVLDTEPTVVSSVMGSAKALPGVSLANIIQHVPLSFRDPTNPSGSDIAQIEAPGCLRIGMPVTAYISGPPTPPTMANVMGR